MFHVCTGRVVEWRVTDYHIPVGEQADCPHQTGAVSSGQWGLGEGEKEWEVWGGGGPLPLT